MRVLFVHHGEVMGGAPVSLLNMILGLKKTPDINMKVLCVNDTMKNFFQEKGNIKVGDIHYPCKILGKVLIGWGNLFNWQTFLMALMEIARIRSSINIQYEQLKKENPDIIHLNSSILFTTAIAARKLHIPVVWHIREILQGSRINFRKMFAGWLIKRFADKVIAISPSEANSLGKDTYHNIEVVYNFVDFSKFDSSLYGPLKEKSKFNIKTNERLIISLGGLSWRKGTLELIEAMEFTQSNVRLIIAGSGIPRPYPLSLVKKLKIYMEDLLVKSGLKIFRRCEYNYRVLKALNKLKKNKVVFTGPLDNIRHLIAACDLLASPHTFPHFSRPIFEAWAMKKPVIAFNMPGISENIDNGIDGVLVKNTTGEALGEAINVIINNSMLLKKMGKDGYKKSYKRFRSEVNILKVLNIYKELTHHT